VIHRLLILPLVSPSDCLLFDPASAISISRMSMLWLTALRLGVRSWA
jgi:hypothetical protein